MWIESGKNLSYIALLIVVVLLWVLGLALSAQKYPRCEGDTLILQNGVTRRDLTSYDRSFYCDIP